MAKISNLEMWPELQADSRVSVKSSFFGMCERAVLVSNGQALKVVKRDYQPESASKLEHLLSQPDDKLASAAAATTINATPVGNIRLDVCFTADHEFAAVQMLRFGDYQYRAVTRPRVLEGAAARAFMDFILKTNKKP